MFPSRGCSSDCQQTLVFRRGVAGEASALHHYSPIPAVSATPTVTVPPAAPKQASRESEDGRGRQASTLVAEANLGAEAGPHGELTP